jgi:hypothetical protein
MAERWAGADFAWLNQGVDLHGFGFHRLHRSAWFHPTRMRAARQIPTHQATAHRHRPGFKWSKGNSLSSVLLLASTRPVALYKPHAAYQLSWRGAQSAGHTHTRAPPAPP